MDENSPSQPQPGTGGYPYPYPQTPWLPPEKMPPAWIYVPNPYYKVQPYPPQPGHRVLTGFGLRFGAAVIDIVTLGLLVACLIMLSIEVVGEETTGNIFLLWLLLLFFCYSPIPTALWGGSPGKLLCGLSVARVADGSRISYGRALWRHLIHAVLTWPGVLQLLNSISCTWDKPLKQCWHDKAAKTVVVREAPTMYITPS